MTTGANVHSRGRDDRVWVSFSSRPRTPAQIEAWYDGLRGGDLEAFNAICAGLPDAEALFIELGLDRAFPAVIVPNFKRFVPKRLPPPVEYFTPPWFCFENSFRLAQAKGIYYVEGLAVNPSGAQIHAWNSTDGQDVLDLSWPRQDLNSYYGVILDLEIVLAKTGAPGGLLARHVEEQGIVI